MEDHGLVSDQPTNLNLKFHPRKFPCHVPFRCPESLDVAAFLAGKISSETQDLVNIDMVSTSDTLEQQAIDLRNGKIQMAMIASRGKISGKLLDLAFIYNAYNNDKISLDPQHRLICQALYKKIYNSSGKFFQHDLGAIANIGNQTSLNLKNYRNLLPQDNRGTEPGIVVPSSDLRLIGHQSLLVLPTNLVFFIPDGYCLISLVTGYQTWNNIRKPLQKQISDLILSLDIVPSVDINDHWP